MKTLSAEGLVTIGARCWFLTLLELKKKKIIQISAPRFTQKKKKCCASIFLFIVGDYSANIHSLYAPTLEGVHYSAPLRLGLAMWLASWLVDLTSLSWSVQAAVTKYQVWVVEKPQKSISHSSGGCKSKIRVPIF